MTLTSNDKSAHAGKTLVVSRSNPGFCLFCKVRHYGFSCSLVEPVGTDTLSPLLTPAPVVSGTVVSGTVVPRLGRPAWIYCLRQQQTSIIHQRGDSITRSEVRIYLAFYSSPHWQRDMLCFLGLKETQRSGLNVTKFHHT